MRDCLKSPLVSPGASSSGLSPSPSSEAASAGVCPILSCVEGSSPEQSYRWKVDACPGLGPWKVLQSFPKSSYQLLTPKEEILLLIKGLSCVNSTLCALLHPFQHHREEGKSIIPILQVRQLRLKDVKDSDQ